MKELTQFNIRKVFTNPTYVSNEQMKTQSVDKFLDALRVEILAGRMGQIEESTDYVGTKTINVSLEAYKYSIEDLIVKKLNQEDASVEELMDMGAVEVAMMKLPENANDKKKIRVLMEGHKAAMYFYFNGSKWRQKPNF
jgi:hypothetical protein